MFYSPDVKLKLFTPSIDNDITIKSIDPLGSI